MPACFRFQKSKKRSTNSNKNKIQPEHLCTYSCPQSGSSQKNSFVRKFLLFNVITFAKLNDVVRGRVVKLICTSRCLKGRHKGSLRRMDLGLSLFDAAFYVLFDGTMVTNHHLVSFWHKK